MSPVDNREYFFDQRDEDVFYVMNVNVELQKFRKGLINTVNHEYSITLSLLSPSFNGLIGV